MKRLLQISIITIVLISISTIARAYDFSSINLGQTIYYNITSPSTVEVAHSPFIHNVYYGTVTIPATVTNGSTTYNVTSIGKDAFNGANNLLNVFIPNSITLIGDNAFANCTELGINNDTIIVPNSVVKLGVYAFYSCKYLRYIILSDSISSIEDHCFSFCDSLRYIHLPDNLGSINDFAFSDCRVLNNVVLPEQLGSLGYFSFGNCFSLTSINIPKNVVNLGYETFIDNLALTSVYFDAINAQYNIKETYFPYCGIKTITFGNDVVNIPKYLLFNNDSIQTIYISPNVTHIGDSAFLRCSVDTLYYNARRCEAPLSYESAWFRISPNLKTVFIGDSVEEIPSYFLSNNFTVTKLVLSNSVRRISYHAFFSCWHLKNLTLGINVDTIDDYIFDNVFALDTLILYKNTPVQITNKTFSGVRSFITVIVPCVSVNDYQEAQYWDNFTNYQSLGYTFLNIDTTINAGDTLNLFGLSFAEDSIYHDTISNDSTCDTILTLTLHVLVGLNSIQNPNNDISMTVFPNPAKDDVNIKINNFSYSATLSIFDIQGRKIKSLNVNKETKNIVLPISSYNKGIYYLNLSSNNKLFTCKKLIIE